MEHADLELDQPIAGDCDQVQIKSAAEGLGQRQSNLEICVAWNRVDRNISMMRSNNSIHGIQAHACAIPNAFGGIKRFKDVAQIIAGNSAAVIGHSDADAIPAVGPVMAGGDAYLQRTLLSHGIDRIHQKIRQKLAQFAGITIDLKLVAVAPRYANLPALKFSRIELQNFVHDAGGIHRFWGAVIADEA